MYLNLLKQKTRLSSFSNFSYATHHLVVLCFGIVPLRSIVRGDGAIVKLFIIPSRGALLCTMRDSSNVAICGLMRTITPYQEEPSKDDRGERVKFEVVDWSRYLDYVEHGFSRLELTLT